MTDNSGTSQIAVGCRKPHGVLIGLADRFPSHAGHVAMDRPSSVLPLIMSPFLWLVLRKEIHQLAGSVTVLSIPYVRGQPPEGFQFPTFTPLHPPTLLLS